MNERTFLSNFTHHTNLSYPAHFPLPTAFRLANDGDSIEYYFGYTHNEKSNKLANVTSRGSTESSIVSRVQCAYITFGEENILHIVLDRVIPAGKKSSNRLQAILEELESVEGLVLLLNQLNARFNPIVEFYYDTQHVPGYRVVIYTRMINKCNNCIYQ